MANLLITVVFLVCDRHSFPRQNMTLKFVVDTRTSITCVHLSTAVCKSCHFSICVSPIRLSTKTSYQQNLHPTLYLCVEMYLSDSVHRTNQSGTHHEQLCVGTNRHANGCKGISSTDGSCDNEKKGTTDHIIIITIILLYLSITSVGRRRCAIQNVPLQQMVVLSIASQEQEDGGWILGELK